MEILEGVYEMPATIPLHYQGVKNLSVYPELKEMEFQPTEKNIHFTFPLTHPLT